ncbi:TRAP transporter T-component [Paucidesulfovibrio gracilis DSM 16080]|uniref:TRAP transporter T-component n=1 Tax=Paucidesulfovibrio gracilis DSM 16080 TaxID=1121449 RepID=A0A1T4XLJ8_9BACT|nr:TRAP transporter TatT component family protein [Paucidesulfovibrio gracilis]SKA90376.1 TRAP transporter T-component [Paucidesulfovibrio gracilis DSM 16080]
MKHRRLAFLTVILVLSGLTLSGCGALMRSATGPVMDNLALSIKKQQDLETVRQGIPSYLLFMDALVQGSPQDEDTLTSASTLLTAYAVAFTLDDQPDRARIMTAKAKDYAIRALAERSDEFARLWDKPAAEFGTVAADLDRDDVKYLHAAITAWGAYIKARPGSWADIADVPKLQALAERLLELDETHAHGAPHALMGVLYTLLPPAYGGKPELAREHFERALEISHRADLLTMVTYAKNYARPLRNRELHDKLLQEVLDAPVDAVPELTLQNALAKQQAAQLQAEADEYF